ncbi:hypothetical protein ACWIGW_24995 [Nocardia brasiliensis]
MAKLPKGALLNWVFDQPDADTQYRLFAFLTDAESEKVYNGSVEEGMLEPVRPTMADPGALLVVLHGDSSVSRRYHIPPYGSEFEFIADLMIAAKAVPQYVESVRFGLTSELARVRQIASEHKVELARLKDEASHTPDDRAAEKVLRYTFA